MQTRHPISIITLHWLMATLVVIAYITGGNPVRNGFEGKIHATSGLLIALLLLIRLPVRLFLKKKIPVHTLPQWQHLLAQLVQVALYLCMILIPLTGLLALSEKTDSYLLFGMNLPSLICHSLKQVT